MVIACGNRYMQIPFADRTLDLLMAAILQAFFGANDHRTGELHSFKSRIQIRCPLSHMLCGARLPLWANNRGCFWMAARRSIKPAATIPDN
jgi:hypothetical protein